MAITKAKEKKIEGRVEYKGTQLVQAHSQQQLLLQFSPEPELPLQNDMMLKSVTESLASLIHGLKVDHLTDGVIRRSKRMILDSLGVGFLGTGTEVFHKVTQYSKMYSSNTSSTVWGRPDFRLPPTYAAFVNGVACREALAIAVSHAGAPIANAATQTKPLHIGNAAKHGMEATFLAMLGLQGNKRIFDLGSGFGAFYTNYSPKDLPSLDSHIWLLDEQDVAFKSFPAHLATHWVADAAAAVRKHLVIPEGVLLPTDHIERIVLRIPDVQYVNRPFPDSEHEARHSFQYVACAMLLDGSVMVPSFCSEQINRPQVRELLQKVVLEHPSDNLPSFNTLYCEISVTLKDGTTFTERSDTFYGHWRKPLSQEDLQKKFRDNASRMLSKDTVESLIKVVESLEDLDDCSVLTSLLKGPSVQEEDSKLSHMFSFPHTMSRLTNV
ncbi:hypothetical protein ACRRTK_019320 [Alexandromys fortis]